MLGALISAGTSLLGGLLGKKSQEKQQNQEYARQKEFAQKGIQWKVQDAKNAGIAPLAALGANTISYGPQSISGGDYGVSAAGQDIGRAIDATRSKGERQSAFTDTAAKLELERGSLQNDLLRLQIAKLSQAGHPPGINTDANGFTIPGQPDSGIPGVEMQPSKTTAAHPYANYTQAGAVPDLHYARTAGGGYYPVPGTLVKQAIEDMTIPEMMWSWRNLGVPFLSTSTAGSPPASQVRKSIRDEWYFNATHGWMLRPKHISKQRFYDRVLRR